MTDLNKLKVEELKEIARKTNALLFKTKERRAVRRCIKKSPSPKKKSPSPKKKSPSPKKKSPSPKKSPKINRNRSQAENALLGSIFLRNFSSKFVQPSIVVDALNMQFFCSKLTYKERVNGYS